MVYETLELSRQKYLSFGATLGILSSVCCFYFILKKLKINHVIRLLLIYVSIQQFLGYITFLCSMILHVNKIRNKLTCFFAYFSIGATTIGTQTIISMISIIRYVNESTVNPRLEVNPVLF